MVILPGTPHNAASCVGVSLSGTSPQVKQNRSKTIMLHCNMIENERK
jgi:hypothetical protein